MGRHDFFKKARGKAPGKHIREVFLIVCEGEKTEPNYFEKFPVKKEIIKLEIQGEGKNTDSLVQEAIKKKEKAEREGNPYVQVWVVFDKDNFPPDRFNNAIRLCDENKIKFALSNEAFELWYLLHYNYYDTAMSRDQYSGKLSDSMGEKYRKNQDDMYETIRERQSTAIKNANKLRKYQYDYFGRHDYCNANPITTVQDLVQAVNDFINED